MLQERTCCHHDPNPDKKKKGKTDGRMYKNLEVRCEASFAGAYTVMSLCTVHNSKLCKRDPSHFLCDMKVVLRILRKKSVFLKKREGSVLCLSDRSVGYCTASLSS